MIAQRRGAQRRAALGLLLAVLGLLVWMLSRYIAGHENHAYTDGGPPARTVALSYGQTYWLAVPGGVDALTRVGLDPTSLRCTASSSGGGTLTLALVDQQQGGNAIDQFASFVAPRSGQFSVTCADVDGVYVDGSTRDPSGWLLVLAVVLLTVGVPLGVSGMRSATMRPVPGLPRSEVRGHTSVA